MVYLSDALRHLGAVFEYALLSHLSDVRPGMVYFQGLRPDAVFAPRQLSIDRESAVGGGGSSVLNVLFVHQSAELYGSDKCLAALAAGIDGERFHSIVLLPQHGPLEQHLAELGVETLVVPLARLARSSLRPKGLWELARQAPLSLSMIKQALGARRIDVVHSNTLASLSGALYARRHRLPHVWHVHEIVEHPAIARMAYPRMLSSLADAVVCNSQATQTCLLKSVPGLHKTTSVIWNGQLGRPPVNRNSALAFRQRLGLSDEAVLVVLMGRISHRKGQHLLVEAAERIVAAGRQDVHFLCVGGAPPGQDHALTTLARQVSDSAARGRIYIEPFNGDVWTIWDAADIAVVPSVLPESFGMVALEAMASAKPVVAAAHGGIVEVIVDNETGLLFPPNDADQLALSILRLASDKKLCDTFGQQGARRCAEVFGIDKYIHGFERLYERVAITGASRGYVHEGQPTKWLSE